MNTLSEQERIALEDVFLSIAPTSANRKTVLAQVVSHINFFNNKNLFARIVYRLKEIANYALQMHNKPIFPHLLHKSNKNKKNLS